MVEEGSNRNQTQQALSFSVVKMMLLLQLTIVWEFISGSLGTWESGMLIGIWKRAIEAAMEVKTPARRYCTKL